MPVADFGRIKYGSKLWFQEVARRIKEYEQQGTKEICTDTSTYEEPLTARDSALLTNAAFTLHNHYQRSRKISE